MSASIKHKFTCNIPDGSDTTIVRPSNWNAEHDISGVVLTVNGTAPDVNGNIDGAVGPQGEQGIQGIQGIQGERGLPGADGLTTSVNGISHVNGNITLTASDVGAATSAQGNNADAHRVDVDTFGFLNQTETSIAFNGTNTFTLSPTGTAWSYYRQGIKHTITGSKSVTIAGTPVATGLYFIYIDSADGTLIASQSAWTLNDSKVPVATIYFNNSLTPKYLMGDERHTVKISRRDHMIEHYTVGSLYSSGGVPSGYTLNSSADVDKCCAISQCNFFDEDIYHTAAAVTKGDGATQTYYTILYRTAASTWQWQRSLVPFKYTGAGNIEYDNNGVMTASSTSRWINYYLIVTNLNDQERFVWVPGRGSFTSATLAASETFSSFSLAGFPTMDAVAIHKFTWRTTGGNLGGCMLYQDPVKISQNIIHSTSTSSTAHDSLAGLSLAESGVTYGHITDQAQTIAGAKTFTENFSITRDLTGYTSGNNNAITNATTIPSSVTANPATIFSISNSITHNGTGYFSGTCISNGVNIGAATGGASNASANSNALTHSATTVTNPNANTLIITSNRNFVTQNGGGNYLAFAAIANQTTIGGTSATPCQVALGNTDVVIFNNTNNLCTIPNAIAHRCSMRANNDTTTQGTVTNAYGLVIGDPTSSLDAGILSSKSFNRRNSGLTFGTSYQIWAGASDATTKWNLYLTDAAANSYIAGRVLIDTVSDDGVNKLQVNGQVKAYGYRISAMQTAPTSATDTGTTGEIRICADHIYICIATNTWVRAALSSW